ncbi:MAG: hypothetical protein QXS19_08945 [Candidatus Methanomethylicia archaeon]
MRATANVPQDYRVKYSSVIYPIFVDYRPNFDTGDNLTLGVFSPSSATASNIVGDSWISCAIATPGKIKRPGQLVYIPGDVWGSVPIVTTEILGYVVQSIAPGMSDNYNITYYGLDGSPQTASAPLSNIAILGGNDFNPKPFDNSNQVQDRFYIAFKGLANNRFGVLLGLPFKKNANGLIAIDSAVNFNSTVESKYVVIYNDTTNGISYLLLKDSVAGTDIVIGDIIGFEPFTNSIAVKL